MEEKTLDWNSPIGPALKEPEPINFGAEPEKAPAPPPVYRVDPAPPAEVIESGVLGSILIDPDKALKLCIDKRVREDSFSVYKNRLIYGAMLAMAKAGRPIDVITLSERLQSKSELDEAGGVMYLNKLLDATPSATHAEYYVDLILDQHARRDLNALAATISNLTRSEKSAGEAINKLTAHLDRIRPVDNTILIRSLTEFADLPINTDNTLLGSRFLCREGGMLFVGPSGVGKSSASVQQDIQWSLGLTAFGIAPARPLRVATIQAENDDGDLTEMARGIMDGLNLNQEQREIVKQNTCYILEKTKTGASFIQFIESVLRITKPDILRLDPLQSYIGGDTSDPEVVSGFVHVGLNPLLQRYQCACIVNHHTPKTNTRDTSKWKSSDWQYAGAGSAVLTNWARAIMIVDPCKENPYLFRFIVAKRGWRVNWTDENDIPTIIRYFKHARENGIIFWEVATQDEAAAQAGTLPTKLDLIDLVPAKESIPKDELIEKAKTIGIGMNKARRFINELVAERALFVWRVRRPNTSPRVDLARLEQPEEKLDL